MKHQARPTQSLLLKEEPVHPRRLQEVSNSRQVEQMRRIAFILLVGLVAQSAPAGAQESRWGAIALGGNGFGATRGRPDEASATSGALRQCEESGGAGECRIRLTYRNQCAAYVAGEDRQVGVAYAGTIKKAGKLALRSCSEAAKNCRIHYAACSVSGTFN
ncbi:DUF4189 domain-containing protein [Methylocystis parvus]|nr:DUF4189 domain-containing protein [Methylocystis parvus]WBK02402.1 DUF4189 domain-containing protein [Methylocystis parvus OBBP]